MKSPIASAFVALFAITLSFASGAEARTSHGIANFKRPLVLEISGSEGDLNDRAFLTFRKKTAIEGSISCDAGGTIVTKWVNNAKNERARPEIFIERAEFANPADCALAFEIGQDLKSGKRNPADKAKLVFLGSRVMLVQ